MPDYREDQASISEVLIRYATGIDRRDWALFRTCWTPDVEADYGDMGRFDGADAITEFMTAVHKDMGSTRHQLSNFVIEVDGDRATASSYVHAVLALSPTDPALWIDAVGGYEDELVRTADGWRISRRSFSATRLVSSTDLPKA
ncbi:nuclear transport factor 2 family protein [Frankia sp. AgB1.9]|uniref:nuclear transport factor 2 family protein n=1 Tax=unclassified Frankia TaxID=2632575 RepID=UPI0019322482|nr:MULTISPECIES: nuclear transport factor 2 family protein [unclassified Frankia]MBL7489374.1 nuclear transport factor 2 family protein [Frankia sp. AgW1.1]MBL7548689.1 nuclear transport factor 2 family protein [Frankia sp. AgB1.9]MBL7619287.1 nuclear transport factor 2 family protein [Frankia sp. AgB1.8]